VRQLAAALAETWRERHQADAEQAPEREGDRLEG